MELNQPDKWLWNTDQLEHHHLNPPTFQIEPQEHLCQVSSSDFDMSQRPIINQHAFPQEVKTRSKRPKHTWTAEENSKLKMLHNSLGNKWSRISKQFAEKSQNDIKNHFFSFLRMSLRHLNKVLNSLPELRMKAINDKIIYKVISRCEQKYKRTSKSDPSIVELCFSTTKIYQDIKTQLFDFMNCPPEQINYKAATLGIHLRQFSTSICKNSKNKLIINQVQITEVEQFFDKNNQTESFLQEEHSEPPYEEVNFELKELGSQEVDTERESPQIKCELPELLIPEVKLEDEGQLIARPSFNLIDPFEFVNLQFTNSAFIFGMTLEDQDSQHLSLFQSKGHSRYTLY